MENLVLETSISKKRPDLIKYWNKEKNGKDTPDNTTVGVHKEAWWTCDEGHEWQRRVSSMTKSIVCKECTLIKNSLERKSESDAKQWHPTRNKELKPKDVSANSNSVAWWKCENGHEWEQSIRSKVEGKKTCLICNSLGYLKKDLLLEWDIEMNNELNPFEIPVKSNKICWWKCDKGHRWEAKLVNRVRGFDNCKECSGRLDTNSFLDEMFDYDKNNIELWELKDKNNKNIWWKCKSGHSYKDNAWSVLNLKACPTCKTEGKSNSFIADVKPELGKEWHPTKNGKWTPENVRINSKRMIWWKCERGHEWEEMSLKRKKTGCQKCNSLAIVRPDLLKEWHHERNINIDLDTIGPKDSRKVWWNGQCGHEWDSRVIERSRGEGCPFCAGRRVDIDNCLATVNPDKAKEWHPVKNTKLTPYHVPNSSTKSAWWICDKGHEWKQLICKKSNCPYCNNRLLHKENSLDVVYPGLAKEWHPTKNRGLLPQETIFSTNKKVWWKCEAGHEWQVGITVRAKGQGQCRKCQSLEVINPELAKEWHPTLNGNLSPIDVFPNQVKKVWWLCKKNKTHSWEAQPNSRHKSNSGCPHCNPKTSFPEQAILYYLSNVFDETINRYQYKTSEKGRKTEIDVYIPEINLGIEYDGVYFHDNKTEKDEDKNRKLKEKVKLIRIRENGLPKIKAYGSVVFERAVNNDDGSLSEVIQNLLSYVKENIYLEKIHYEKLSDIDIDVVRDRNEIMSIMDNVDVLDSLESSNPKLALEWHPTKNRSLKPVHVTSKSQQKVWWLGDCGHEWESFVSERAMGRGKCSVCKKQFHPQLIKEWHPTKNGDLKLSQFRASSPVKVWWLGDCGHEWESYISERKKGQGTCRTCRLKPITHLEEEWHPSKNGQLKLSDVSRKSDKVVWWQGECGHEWEARINTRISGYGKCPTCRQNKKAS